MFIFVFVFKQKTAYELRISDWSSDVCSSDLAAAEDDVVVIKKYANRRLYDTERSCYITLEDLGAMVREGRDFSVIDAKSGEDITHNVLTQIIMDTETRGSGLRAHVVGESDLGVTLAYWRAIARRARECAADSLLLVDELVGRSLGEADWLTLVASMQGEGLEKLRIAHVQPLGLKTDDFGEIFARHDGNEATGCQKKLWANNWMQ